MEKELIKPDVEKEPQLSGEIVRIINPENGADIHHEKHMFGKTFSLKRGESKKVDKAIADGAKYQWGFLIVQPLTEELEAYEERISELGDLPEGYKYPENVDKNASLDFDAYQFHLLQALAKKLKIVGAMLSKKDNLLSKIEAKSNQEILVALQELKVPALFKETLENKTKKENGK